MHNQTHPTGNCICTYSNQFSAWRSNPIYHIRITNGPIRSELKLVQNQLINQLFETFWPWLSSSVKRQAQDQCFAVVIPVCVEYVRCAGRCNCAFSLSLLQSQMINRSGPHVMLLSCISSFAILAEGRWLTSSIPQFQWAPCNHSTGNLQIYSNDISSTRLSPTLEIQAPIRPTLHTDRKCPG